MGSSQSAVPFSSAMKKRLLFFIPNLGGGEAEKGLVTLLNLLDRSKYAQYKKNAAERKNMPDMRKDVLAIENLLDSLRRIQNS